MAYLLERAKAVEAKLTVFVELGALVALRRRPNMTRRWVAEMCQAPGSTGTEEVVLDTVHDAEIFASGLESALYGIAANVRKWAEEEGADFGKDFAGTMPGLGMSPEEMTRRTVDRYGEALNTLNDCQA